MAMIRAYLGGWPCRGIHELVYSPAWTYEQPGCQNSCDGSNNRLQQVPCDITLWVQVSQSA